MLTLTEPKNGVHEKISCLSQKELLNYANGKLSEKEKRKVESHLLECELCISAYQDALNKKEAIDINNRYSDLFPEPRQKNFRIKFISKRKLLTIFCVLSGVIILVGAYSKLNRDSVKDNNAYSPLSTTRKIITEPITSDKPPVAPHTEDQKITDRVPEEINEPPGTSADADGKVLNENKPAEKTPGEIKADKQKPLPAEIKKTDETISSPPAAASSKNSAPAKDSVIKTAPAPAPVTAFIKNYKISSPPDELPTGNFSKALELIFKQIDQSEYKNALTEIGKFSYDYPGDINAKYYRGYIYYMMEDNEHALAEMEGILEKRNKIFYEDARWYKALILNRTKKFDEAKKILKEITSQNSSYSSKAKQLQELMGDK